MYAAPITLRDFSVPLTASLSQHKEGRIGPYYRSALQGTEPAKGWGGYLGSDGQCDRTGCSFRLRIESAQAALKAAGHWRTAQTEGFYGDPENCESTWYPYIVRLNHGRGFLAATGLGPSMYFSVEADIHGTEKEAAWAAYQLAERTAEEDYRQTLEMRAELDEEERQAEFASADYLPEDGREN